MRESHRAATRLLTTAARNSEAVAWMRCRDLNQWFCSKKPFGLLWLKGWKPPLFPQMRAIGFLVILLLILSCSGRRLYNLVWKLHEIMCFWVLYMTRSWNQGLVRFGVPPIGEIQNETQQVELKEKKHEVTWLNYEQVTFCCDSENLLQSVEWFCVPTVKAWSCRVWFILWLNDVFKHVTRATYVHFRLQATNPVFVTSSMLLRGV